MNPLGSYTASIQKELAAGNSTEHTHRPALKQLIESIEKDVTAVNEPKRIECGAPDFAVYRRSLPVGFVETKDVGVKLEDEEESDQLERYRSALRNLILTDYLEFRWYVDGTLKKSVQLASYTKGQLHLSKAGGLELQGLLLDFISFSPAPVESASELSRRMARFALVIRDTVVAAFEKGRQSKYLDDLRQALAETLIPELADPKSTSQFADMYAQSIVYGLFAARCNHKPAMPFTRNNAARDIPKTNPFLQQLFEMATGVTLDEEPYVDYIEDLVSYLAAARMEKVLENLGKKLGRDDPVIQFYETFLKAYDPEVREVRGVFYTPAQVVSYIVRSVDEILKSDFGLREGLADSSQVSITTQHRDSETQPRESPHESTYHRVIVLDPACGTGTFLYSVIDNIRDRFISHNDAGLWSGYVRTHLLPRLLGFELLMAPYAVAHFKLGIQLAGLDMTSNLREQWAYDFAGNERIGVYLTDTLEEPERAWKDLLGPMRILTDEARSASWIKNELPIMVVLGNPPYQGESRNKGPWILSLLADYQKYDGKPLQEIQQKWLHDDYVKFIRWAQWRIERSGSGILAFITNHKYLDNATFGGMRQQLLQFFDDVYVLDLHGNSREKELAPGGAVDENVFDIQQGVAIGIFVKRQNRSRPTTIHYHERWGSRSSKYDYLDENNVSTTRWVEFAPSAPLLIFKPQDADLLAEFNKSWSLANIMPVHSVGIVTARDKLTIHFTTEELMATIKDFASITVDEARSKYKLGDDARDWKVASAQEDLRSSGFDPSGVVPIYYRPFDSRYTYFTGRRGFIGQPQLRVMNNMRSGKNVALVTTRSTEIGRGWEHVLCTDRLIQHHTVSLKEVNYLFPLFVQGGSDEMPDSSQGVLDASLSWYTQDSTTVNLNPLFLREVEDRTGLRFVTSGASDSDSVGPHDILGYIYAVLHSEGYRRRFSDQLKRDYPHVPIASDPKTFLQLASLGKALIALHLGNSQIAPNTRYPIKGSNRVSRGFPKYESSTGKKVEVGKPRSEGKVHINETQYFEGIDSKVWEYHVGGYQVLSKWLEDREGRTLDFEDLNQYQRIVATAKTTLELTGKIDQTIGTWPVY